MTIPSGIRTPGTYVDYNLDTQRTGLPLNPQKLLFITADRFQTDGQTLPVTIYDTSTADAALGVSSIAGQMMTAALAVNTQVNVQALGKGVPPA